KELGLTTVLVTHDQEEALSIADRLVLMNAGAVAQVGAPSELYDRPADTFVADFIGTSNFFHGALAGDRFVTASGYTFTFDGRAQGDATVLAVRPENIVIAGAEARANTVSGIIADITYL